MLLHNITSIDKINIKHKCSEGFFINENMNIKIKFSPCIEKIQPLVCGILLNNENSFTKGAIKNLKIYGNLHKEKKLIIELEISLIDSQISIVTKNKVVMPDDKPINI